MALTHGSIANLRHHFSPLITFSETNGLRQETSLSAILRNLFLNFELEPDTFENHLTRAGGYQSISGSACHEFEPPTK